jgi:Uma2 family endonuclease
MATGIVLTYEDYTALPDDGRRYELHEGELSVAPAPSPRHQESVVNLVGALSVHVKRAGLGKVFVAPIDCILSHTTIVQPDLVYVDTSRLDLITSRGIEGPPTLVVEILSPSTAQIDRRRKMALYAKFGVPHYWIVDPDARRIEAYGLVSGGSRFAAGLEGSAPLTLPPFPDLALDPATLWS